MTGKTSAIARPIRALERESGESSGSESAHVNLQSTPLLLYMEGHSVKGSVLLRSVCVQADSDNAAKYMLASLGQSALTKSDSDGRPAEAFAFALRSALSADKERVLLMAFRDKLEASVFLRTIAFISEGSESVEVKWGGGNEGCMH